MSLFSRLTPDDGNEFTEMHSEILNKKWKKLKSLNFLGWRTFSNKCIIKFFLRLTFDLWGQCWGQGQVYCQGQNQDQM